MKKIILTLIVLAVIGGGTYAYYKNKGTVAPTVSTMQLTRGDIADTVQATGTLEPVETVDVGTQVSGIVMELHADFNHFVKKGQIIARLDPSLIETALERSEANVTRAEADLDRLRVSLADAERKLEQAKQMWDKQLIPKDQLDTADLNVKQLQSQIVSSEAGLVQAKADLNTQRVNLGHTIIKAPIDGIVISRSVDQGQTVAASMNAPVLYQLAEDLTKMQVLANIDEAEIGKLRMGQEVEFTVDAFPNDEFTGKVQEVRLLPTTVQNVVTYTVVIEAPNPQYKLKPGMTANVTIEIARRSDVLRAPAAALRFRPTADMFTALNLPVPEDLNRGMGRGGGPGGRGGGRAGFNGASGQRGGGSPEAGGRGGNNMSPEERRKQMEERMASMSPEERERLQARMRDGGPRGGQAPPPQPVQVGNAATIDALFAPVQIQESRARIWLRENGQLRAVNVRTGISDGTWTEIIANGEASELQAGTEVVTNILTGMESAQRPGQQGPGGNPLMPQQGGRGGRGR
jgi:HlyD family secretion protein